MKTLTLEKVIPDKEKIIKFCENNGIVYLGIFGSYVNGVPKNNSDIDILIKFERLGGLLEFISTKYELSKLFGRKVDLVEKGALHHLLKDKILSGVVTIYEK